MGLLFVVVTFSVTAQKIVVDSTSTNKYLIKPKQTEEAKAKDEDLAFGDRALSIGRGILNRLKARLNLEDAAESLKDKKDKILGREEKEEDAKKDDG